MNNFIDMRLIQVSFDVNPSPRHRVIKTHFLNIFDFRPNQNNNVLLIRNDNVESIRSFDMCYLLKKNNKYR